MKTENMLQRFTCVSLFKPPWLIAPRRHQPLTQTLNHKCLAKVRPFNSTKVRCMHDHGKPTVRDFDLDHIILHCETNDLNSNRTSSQIVRDYRSSTFTEV